MKILSLRLLLCAVAVSAAAFALVSKQAVEAEAAPGKPLAQADVREPDAAEAEMDPTVLKDKAMRVMETYCYSCHGPEKQKGSVRFDVLETIDPVDRQDLFALSKEVVHFDEMPPPKAKQPSDEERLILMKWLQTQVSGDAAKALAEKLKRFDYGNVVDHEALFSGAYADLPAATPDRRWMISEFIFNEKVNRLLDYHPKRTIYGESVPVAGDSGVHWSPIWR